MSKNEHIAPAIRFEFSDNYKKYQLSKLMSRVSENNRDEEFSIDDILSLSTRYGIVDRKELLDDTYDKVNHKNYIKTRLNDFVFGKSISSNFPYGVFKANKVRDGLLSTLYFTFKVSNKVLPSYLDCYFSHQNRANNFLKKYVLVGDRYITVDPDDLLKGKIYIPSSSKEQQKITSFFSVIDCKINSLSNKKELLEEYKRGVAQKLFSQKIRFKNDKGKEFPKWNYKNGNKVFKSISDKDHNSDLPILAITQEHGAIPRELINYKISVSEKSVSTYKVVQKGDFIISLRSFQGGIEYSNYKGICSPAYIVLRPFVDIDDQFYKHYLKTESYVKELNRKLEGIRDGKMVSYKYFSEILLPFPHKDEQIKIANFLSTIDKKIGAVDKQLQETVEWKKGLLQKMFC
ncbi:restriction endonuclease subunit S [bacterium SCSIO 12643]|nr:restriction endonuclease subunit S [bacterium SCSIO 12643]